MVSGDRVEGRPGWSARDRGECKRSGRRQRRALNAQKEKQTKEKRNKNKGRRAPSLSLYTLRASAWQIAVGAACTI